VLLPPLAVGAFLYAFQGFGAEVGQGLLLSHVEVLALGTLQTARQIVFIDKVFERFAKEIDVGRKLFVHCEAMPHLLQRILPDVRFCQSLGYFLGRSARAELLKELFALSITVSQLPRRYPQCVSQDVQFLDRDVQPDALAA